MSSEKPKSFLSCKIFEQTIWKQLSEIWIPSSFPGPEGCHSIRSDLHSPSSTSLVWIGFFNGFERLQIHNELTLIFKIEYLRHLFCSVSSPWWLDNLHRTIIVHRHINRVIQLLLMNFFLENLLTVLQINPCKGFYWSSSHHILLKKFNKWTK